MMIMNSGILIVTCKSSRVSVRLPDRIKVQDLAGHDRQLNQVWHKARAGTVRPVLPIAGS